MYFHPPTGDTARDVVVVCQPGKSLLSTYYTTQNALFTQIRTCVFLFKLKSTTHTLRGREMILAQARPDEGLKNEDINNAHRTETTCLLIAFVVRCARILCMHSSGDVRRCYIPVYTWDNIEPIRPRAPPMFTIQAGLFYENYLVIPAHEPAHTKTTTTQKKTSSASIIMISARVRSSRPHLFCVKCAFTFTMRPLSPCRSRALVAQRDLIYDPLRCRSTSSGYVYMCDDIFSR